MRRLVALAVAIASAACSATTPEDWYTPQNGWDGGYAGNVAIAYPDGRTDSYVVKKNGTSPALQVKINELAQVDKDLAAAYQALYEALQAQMMVRNMAENLNDLFAGGPSEYVNQDSTKSSGGYKFKVDGNKFALELTGVTSMKADNGLTKVGSTIGLANWTAGAKSERLSDTLSGKSAAYRDYEVLARGPNGSVSLVYLPIGSGLDGGGAQADGVTISTNADGRIEIHNWTSEGRGKAKDCAIPYADSEEGGVKWGRFFGFFNGELFGWDDDDDRVTLKGWTANMGTRHYFGTGDTEGEFGFHELPNVTTNRVEGDGKTIGSTTEQGQDGDVKKLGLVGWPPASPGLPYAVGADAEQRLVFMPLPEQLTNETAFAFDDLSLGSNSENKVEIKGWSAAAAESDTLADILTGAGSGSSSGEGTFEVVARSGGAGGSLKYISVGDGIAQPDDSQFVTDDSTGKFKLNSQEGKFLRGTANNGVEWVAMAGDTAVDNKSISTNASGTLEIKGFASAVSCGAPLSEMLKDPNGSEAKSHLFLAKKTGSGGELHYVEIGNGVGAGQVDGESVKTNSAGRIEIAGFSDYGTADGMVPVKSGNSLSWAAMGGCAIRLVGTDASEAVVGGGSVTNVVTFSYAETSSNVTVSVFGDGAGNATIKIGAYWR